MGRPDHPTWFGGRREVMTMEPGVVEQEDGDHERTRRDLPVAATTKRLQLCGLSMDEAANLTAHLSGLAVARSGWTVRQIEHLLFLRSIVESGRLKA
jgi:hypothetical protein